MTTTNLKSHFELHSTNCYKLIKLNGHLDGDSAKLFSESLIVYLTPPKIDVIVNFESVSNLSPQWIRVFIDLLQSLNFDGKNLRFVCVSDQIKRTLKQEGVEEEFKYSDSLRSALSELGLMPSQILEIGFINPFLESATKVVQIQASTIATYGKPFRKLPGDKFLGDISGVIALVTDIFKGTVVISFPENTFLKIMSRMLGEEYLKITNEIIDGAGEITNIIFGQAKIILNERGFGIKTALPSVVVGGDQGAASGTNGAGIAIPFESDAGPFYVEIYVSN